MQDGCCGAVHPRRVQQRVGRWPQPTFGRTPNVFSFGLNRAVRVGGCVYTMAICDDGPVRVCSPARSDHSSPSDPSCRIFSSSRLSFRPIGSISRTLFTRCAAVVFLVFDYHRFPLLRFYVLSARRFGFYF